MINNKKNNKIPKNNIKNIAQNIVQEKKVNIQNKIIKGIIKELTHNNN